MATNKEVELQQSYRAEAAKAYAETLEPNFEAEAWRDAVQQSWKLIESTLKVSDNLKKISAALAVSGGHMYVLRYFLAPPLSQDQFKLACPSWSKGSEDSGRVAEACLGAVEAGFQRWVDKDRKAAITQGTAEERRAAINATAHMMAINSYRTVKRNRLAREQEQAVLRLLEGAGYVCKPSKPVDQPGVLEEREMMHKTLFKTADGSQHEVDVAVGLKGRHILALECKVSNDSTNSVKRVNDVLKKAVAWKKQWGEFVITGAVLQGVYSKKEPRRLLEGDVLIFWSHRLEGLSDWLRKQLESSKK